MILSANIVLTIKGNDVPLRDGAVVVDRGMIIAVGSLAQILRRYPGRPVHELRNAVLMPGLINVHAHLELPPLLDAIRASSFSDWILNLISAKKDLTPADYRWAAEANIRELVRSGTTTVGEICTHDASPAVLKRHGLRSIVFKELIAMAPLTKTRERSLLKRPGRDTSLMTWGFSPHAPYTASLQLLHALSSGRNRDLPCSMHIAESREELLLLQRKRSTLERLYTFAHWDPSWAPEGDTPVEYLDRTGILSNRLLAVHSVHVTDEDIRRLKRSGTSVAHCPRSNHELAAGRMPLRKLLRSGIPVGLGTDSLASSPTLNLWDEMRYAYRIHGRDGISARAVLELATIGGACALGMERSIGTVTVGKKADLIAVSLPRKRSNDLYADLLRETRGSIMTMVQGRFLSPAQWENGN